MMVSIAKVKIDHLELTYKGNGEGAFESEGEGCVQTRH
jgi:hypothetical protein